MKTALKVLGILFIVFIVAIPIAKWGINKIPNVKEHASIITLTQDNFQQEISNGIVLVDFWAEWCGPCKVMAPVLNEVADETKNTSTHVAKLNVDDFPSLAKQYNVETIPTLIIFKDGKEQDRFVGLKTKGSILKELEKY